MTGARFTKNRSLARLRFFITIDSASRCLVASPRETIKAKDVELKTEN